MDKFWDSLKSVAASLRQQVQRGAPMFAPGSASSATDRWHPGDWAVYRKSKRSTNPGRRACRVKANAKGETYAYVVEKFWVVERVLPNGNLILRTARGKTHQIDPEDPNLLRPNLLARLRWGERFRSIEQRVEETSLVT